MFQEIELKLQLDPLAASSLATSSFIKKFTKEAPVFEHLVSHYYDTPTMELAEQGFALRVRQQGSRFIQTLKNTGKVKDGLHERSEWESEIPENEIDIDLLPRAVFEKISSFSNKLIPVFSTEFDRMSWQLTAKDGSHLELALDQGEIKVSSWRELICEIELELKEGSKESLLDLAEKLKASVTAKPFDQSKAMRGYQLFKVFQKNLQAQYAE